MESEIMVEENKNLYYQIESILFDENNLNVLKSSISSLSKGNLAPKVVKEQIIEFRLNAVQEIVKLFNFYHRQLTIATSLDKYTESPNNLQLEQDLFEKNDFFQEVGKRIQNIQAKLKHKLKINP